jgi:hypothetical protein
LSERGRSDDDGNRGGERPDPENLQTMGTHISVLVLPNTIATPDPQPNARLALPTDHFLTQATDFFASH